MLLAQRLALLWLARFALPIRLVRWFHLLAPTFQRPLMKLLLRSPRTGLRNFLFCLIQHNRQMDFQCPGWRRRSLVEAPHPASQTRFPSQ